MSIGVRIEVTTKYFAMEIAQKLGSGLKLRDASVESKISAKFAKKTFWPTNENCVQNIKIPKSSKITFCSKLVWRTSHALMKLYFESFRQNLQSRNAGTRFWRMSRVAIFQHRRILTFECIRPSNFQKRLVRSQNHSMYHIYSISCTMCLHIVLRIYQNSDRW